MHNYGPLRQGIVYRIVGLGFERALMLLSGQGLGKAWSLVGHNPGGPSSRGHTWYQVDPEDLM